jgi:hypothetical protein
VTNAREINSIDDRTVKQEVPAKAQRIRRCEKQKNQYTQNKMFKNDTKIFYTNVSMKNIGRIVNNTPPPLPPDGRSGTLLKINVGRKSTT